MLNHYDHAIRFCAYYLQYAWHCEKEKDELEAYYLIGLYYFYRDDMAMCKYYINRTENGEIED